MFFAKSGKNRSRALHIDIKMQRAAAIVLFAGVTSIGNSECSGEGYVNIGLPLALGTCNGWAYPYAEYYEFFRYTCDVCEFVGFKSFESVGLYLTRLQSNFVCVGRWNVDV